MVSSNYFSLVIIICLRIAIWLQVIDTNRSLNSQPDDRPSDSEQKKRTFQTADFAIPADHRGKIKESEKDKYVYLARGLKKNYGI